MIKYLLAVPLAGPSKHREKYGILRQGQAADCSDTNLCSNDRSRPRTPPPAGSWDVLAPGMCVLPYFAIVCSHGISRATLSLGRQPVANESDF